MSSRTVFACQSCGAQSQKWLGRCPDCSAWNTFVEEKTEVAPVSRQRAAAALGGSAPQRYADVERTRADRMSTGLTEFDRVLGGGIVPGSLVLLGGEPGIGKSTLLLQAAAHFATPKGRPC